MNFKKDGRIALTAYYGAADKYIGMLDIRIRLGQGLIGGTLDKVLPRRGFGL